MVYGSVLEEPNAIRFAYMSGFMSAALEKPSEYSFIWLIFMDRSAAALSSSLVMHEWCWFRGVCSGRMLGIMPATKNL